MAGPTQSEAIAVLEDGQARLRELLTGLSDEDTARPDTIGDGDWSAKDLIAHIETWETFALTALGEWRAGDKPAIEDTFASQTVDELNARMVSEKRARSVEEVRSEADRVHAALVGELRMLTDEEWQGKAPYPTERRNRLCTLLGSILGAPDGPFRHAFAHLPDLERYARSLGSKL